MNKNPPLESVAVPMDSSDIITLALANPTFPPAMTTLPDIVPDSSAKRMVVNIK